MITFFTKNDVLEQKLHFQYSRIDINIRNLCYNEMHNTQLYVLKCVDFN